MKSLRRLVRAGSIQDRATRRVVIAVAACAFAEWGGASSVLPLLPIYLRHHGSSLPMVGLTMAAFFAAAVLVQYPMGRLSDRIGRRQIQIGGLIAYSVATVLFALFAAPWAAFFFRALQGAGTGIVDVANAAMIGEVVPEKERGKAFGSFYGARTVGMAIGPFLGGLTGVGHMDYLFLAAAAVVLTATVPITFLTPRTSGHLPVRRHERTPLWRSRSVMGVGLAFLAGGLLIGTYEVCWSLLLDLRGATSWELGLSWTLFAFPFAVVSLPAGWLVDHMDRRALVIFSLAGSAAFALVYPFLHSVAWLVGLGALEAVTVALGAPAELAQLSSSVPARELGRAQGAVASMQTGAVAVMATISGALFGVRPWLPFVVAAGAIGAVIVALSFVWRGVPGRGSLPGHRPLEPAAGPVGVASPLELSPERLRVERAG